MKRENTKRRWATALTLFIAILNIATVSAEEVSHSIVIRRIKEAKEVRSLPKKHSTIEYNGTSYYEANDRYYVECEDGFKFATPPSGLKVDALPEGATMFQFLDRKYYIYRGVLYKYTSDGECEITLPEVGMTLTEMPETTTREIVVDGNLYIEADGLMYRPTPDGQHFIVVCTYESLAS